MPAASKKTDMSCCMTLTSERIFIALMRVSIWTLIAIPPAFIDMVIVMPRSADAGETVQTSNTSRVAAARFMTRILLAAELAADEETVNRLRARRRSRPGRRSRRAAGD